MFKYGHTQSKCQVLNIFWKFDSRQPSQKLIQEPQFKEPRFLELRSMDVWFFRTSIEGLLIEETSIKEILIEGTSIKEILIEGTSIKGTSIEGTSI